VRSVLAVVASSMRLATDSAQRVALRVWPRSPICPNRMYLQLNSFGENTPGEADLPQPNVPTAQQFWRKHPR